MKRRGFFGALLAAFFPAVPATAADPWADIHFSDWPIDQLPDPVYPAPRITGVYIWSSSKRTIPCTGVVTSPTYRYRLGEEVDL